MVQDFLNLRLFLTFYHDNRRSLHTSTVVVGVVQHTDMEGRMDVIVSKYLQCVVDRTSLSQDLEGPSHRGSSLREPTGLRVTC